MTSISQQATCTRFGASFEPPDDSEMVGLARVARTGRWPVHGLRHPAEGQSCGWFIWAVDDEIPTDPAAFEPVHVAHLAEDLPCVVPYLALPPGWRFLLAPDYEDVWYDPSLLII